MATSRPVRSTKNGNISPSSELQALHVPDSNIDRQWRHIRHNRELQASHLLESNINRQRRQIRHNRGLQASLIPPVWHPLHPSPARLRSHRTSPSVVSCGGPKAPALFPQFFVPIFRTREMNRKQRRTDGLGLVVSGRQERVSSDSSSTHHAPCRHTAVTHDVSCMLSCLSRFHQSRRTR